MTARLVDVAEAAGVSVKTVSNVVHKSPHVRPGTRARVEQVIKELDYQPNRAARQLKAGRTGFIALALPEIKTPYFAELTSRISERAKKEELVALLELTGADPVMENRVLTRLGRGVVDGIVFSPLTLTAKEISDHPTSVPMVLLGERATPPNHDHVAVRSVDAARRMTEHLIEVGCQRIAAIGHVPNQGTASTRLAGYRQALKAADIPFDDDLVVGVSTYSRSAGFDAMNSLLGLAKKPDAVFCFNDTMAIGAIRACHEAGVKVPQDIAIAGFDNTEEGVYSTPTLTTIAPDLDALADKTLTILVQRIGQSSSNANQSGTSVPVPWHLVIRESTGGPTIHP
ncbi:LacI family DNA-binding transcriptional regulator [Cutibacterium porci]|nr:LacI family DNA-binding transcriptional regulator [Cutibacterium porci]